MNSEAEVIIIGGGPAGASLAIRLAQWGLDVAVFEERRFPRHKLCGEFISPECFYHFAQFGLCERMERAGGTELRETVFYSPRGRSFVIPNEWFGGPALGLSRARMDDLLLARARDVGARVYLQTRAIEAIEDDGRIVGVITRGADGVRQMRARLIVDATGKRRAIARKLERRGARNGPSRRALIAFKAHLRSAQPARATCEIYFYRGGYGGLSPIEDGLCNLCFIVSAGDVRACAGDVPRLVRELICVNPRAAQTLRDAEPVTPWSSVSIERFGPLELAPAENLLVVGDAASFIDPFTGSGILLALENSALLARILKGWWQSDAESWEELACAYRSAYEARFGWRLRWSAALRRLIHVPPSLLEIGAAFFGMGALRRAVARATRASRASRLCS